MWRIAFLLLVVIGALTVIIGSIFGVGLWQASRLQAAQAEAEQAQVSALAAVSAAKAAAKATPPAPVASPENERPVPFRPPVRPPVAIAEPNWPPPDPARGGRPPVDADPRQQVEGVKPGEAPVILLDVRSAVIHGDDLRLDGNPKAAINWRNTSDALTWTLNAAKQGIYQVELEYACDPREGGGVIWLQVGRSPRVSGLLQPTAGWQDFRTVSVGQVIVMNGETDVMLRPLYLQQDKQLMNLRSVKLTMVRDIPEGMREGRRFGRMDGDRRGFLLGP